MKTKWIWTTLGVVPFLAAMISLQSCGGEGGPIGGGGGGSISQAFLDLLSPEQQAATSIGPEACADGACHGGRTEPAIYTTWLETKHAERGVTCEKCHGNGSVHASNPAAGHILTFPKSVSPIVCAQCHGEIFDEFETAGHAELITSPLTNTVNNVATYGRSSRCAECHSGLYRTMTYEQGRDIPDLTDDEIRQIANWALDPQNHANQIANCATCHDPHAKTGNLNDDGEEVQLRHKVFQDDEVDDEGHTIAPGATSDSFTKFNHICAQCHNGRGANGADSALASSTSRPNMHDSNQFNTLIGIGGAESPTPPVERNMSHATIPGQCSKCHMPSSRHSFRVSFDAGCSPCHTAADAASRLNALNNEMTDALFALRTSMENWALATYNSSMPGYTPGEMNQSIFRYLWDYSSNINSVITELGFDPNDATQSPPSTHQASIPIQVKRARHNYYFILRDSSLCPHNPPYARYLIDWANQNMDDLGFNSMAGANRTRSLTRAQKKQILEQDRQRAIQSDLEPLRGGEG